MGPFLQCIIRLSGRANLGQPTFGKPDGDRRIGFLRFPADFSTVFDDVLYHVGAEHARALGDDHLAVGKFVEFYFDFDSPISAAFGPAILEVVETEYFAFLEGESHVHESSGS